MRILVLTQVLPYPQDAGPKIRACYVLRHLAERGHAVTLVSFVRADDTPEAVAHLRQYCPAVHTVPVRRSRPADARFLAASLLSGRPFIIARDTHHGMQALVDRLMHEHAFDVVHADQLWMAQYALRCHGVRRVLDAHNVAPFGLPRGAVRHLRGGRSLCRLDGPHRATAWRHLLRAPGRTAWQQGRGVGPAAAQPAGLAGTPAPAPAALAIGRPLPAAGGF
jgi:hypothetical protein